MGLLDMLGGLGTTPPSYMEGLLGAQATEDLRKRSIGSGLVNALIGYAAAPKNQNLGLGRILASAAQSGLQGARGVYDTAAQDLVMQQRIEDMKRQRLIADRDFQRQAQMEALAPQLIQTIPAQYRDVETPPSFMPTPAMEGDVAPNFNLQPVANPPTREMITPESSSINMDVVQRMAGLSKDPLATLKTSAELVPALRTAGLIQTGRQTNPFDMFIESESPVVQKLARTYKDSYANNLINDEKAQSALAQLGNMEDRYGSRVESAETRKAEADRIFELRQQLADSTISQAQFNQQMAQNTLGMRQDALDFKREEAERKGQKVLPSGALKLESDDIATGYETVQLTDDINNQINSLITNKVNFSPANNAKLAVQSFAGATTPEVLAYNDFNRFKVKLVNDSLRLNKGVQTEGDAIRAAKELSSAKSTADAVAAMQKLRDINARNAKVRNQIIVSRRKSGGLTEERGYAPPEQVPVPKYENVYFSEKDAGFAALPKGAIFIDGNTGKRKRK
jgi:hypothetical protein